MAYSLLFAFSPLLTLGFGAACTFGLAAVSTPRLHRSEALVLRTATAALSVSLAAAVLASGRDWILYPGGPSLFGAALFIAVAVGPLLGLGTVAWAMTRGFSTPAGQSARKRNSLRNSDPVAQAAIVSALAGSLALPALAAVVLAIIAIIRSHDPARAAPDNWRKTSRDLATGAIAIAVLWIATWSIAIALGPPQP